MRDDLRDSRRDDDTRGERTGLPGRSWFSRRQRADAGSTGEAGAVDDEPEPIVDRPPGHLSRLRIPSHVLRDTLTGLSLGRDREMLAYWVGMAVPSEGDGLPSAIVTTVAFPRIESTDNYFRVADGQLAQIATWCATRRLWVLAQVHTHPTDEPHSEADEQWPASHRAGFLSVVFPYFAQLSSLREPHWRVYENQGAGIWDQVAPAARLEVLADVWLPS